MFSKIKRREYQLKRVKIQNGKITVDRVSDATLIADLADDAGVAVEPAVKEPHIEYDIGEIDQRDIVRMRARGMACRERGILVDGLFKARNQFLDLEEIEREADNLATVAAGLKHMIRGLRKPLSCARTVACVLLALGTLALCGCGHEHDNPIVNATRPGCVDGHCSAR